MTLMGHADGGQIILDGPHALPDGTVVEIEPVSMGDDASTFETMRVVERSGALDFWNDPAEDVYSPNDGEPL